MKTYQMPDWFHGNVDNIDALVKEINKRLEVLEQEGYRDDKYLLQTILGMQYGIIKVAYGVNTENLHPEGICTAVCSINGIEEVELEINEVFLSEFVDILRMYCKAGSINIDE